MRRYMVAGAGAALAVAAAVLTYTLILSARGGRADSVAIAQQPIQTPTPVAPGAVLSQTPDKTKPLWYVPYLEAERFKPVRDQMINGISVGPTVTRQLAPCPGNNFVNATAQQTAGSPVEIMPKYLPAGTAILHQRATACRGVDGSLTMRATEAEYSIPDNPRIGRKGGRVGILRFLGQPSVPLAIPAERISAGQVAGKPAVIARPILPDGLGESVVIIFSNGVVTVVNGTDLSLEEVIRVAEGLF